MTGRMLAAVLAASACFAGLILFEYFSPDSGGHAAVKTVPPKVEGEPQPHRSPAPKLDDATTTVLAAPLFSPTRRPENHTSGDAAGTEFPDVRLTAIVIEPDRRLAIFAVPGAKPLVLAEGEALKDWRIDSISPQEVSFSGPAGSRTLAPKPDANLVRPPPPAPVSAAKPQPRAEAGGAPAAAGAAAQPRPGQPLIGPPRIQLPPNAPTGQPPGALPSPPSRTR